MPLATLAEPDSAGQVRRWATQMSDSTPAASGQVAADVYPIEVRFYRVLAARATLLKTFSPGPGESGPVIKIYEL